MTIAVLIYAAWSDLTTRIIPNSACVAIAAAGAIARATVGAGALGWSFSLSLLLFCLLVGAHAFGALGGGDVKLITATAICLPPAGTLHFITAAALSGAILAMLHLMLRRLPHPAPCPSGAPALNRVCAV